MHTKHLMWYTCSIAVQPVPSPTTFSPQRVQMPRGGRTGKRWKVDSTMTCKLDCSVQPHDEKRQLSFQDVTKLFVLEYNTICTKLLSFIFHRLSNVNCLWKKTRQSKLTKKLICTHHKSTF